MRFKTILLIATIIILCCNPFLNANSGERKINIKYSKPKFVINNVEEMDCSGLISEILYKFEYDHSHFYLHDPWPVDVYHLKKYPIVIFSTHEGLSYNFSLNEDTKLNLSIYDLELSCETKETDIERYLKQKSISYYDLKEDLFNTIVTQSYLSHFVFKDGYLISCKVDINKLKCLE